MAQGLSEHPNKDSLRRSLGRRGQGKKDEGRELKELGEKYTKLLGHRFLFGLTKIKPGKWEKTTTPRNLVKGDPK